LPSYENRDEARLLILLIVVGPLIAGALAYASRSAPVRSAVLLAVAVLHSIAVAVLWVHPTEQALGGWLMADDLGLLVLALISALFLVVAHYAANYLRGEIPRGGRAFESCLMAFLSAASLVALSQHLALLWIGMESTTLAIAPLIYSRDDRRSLEAVWKYLVLSSVGIALALLAVFLLATAQPEEAGSRALMLPDLIAGAARLDPWWLRTSFVFALLGFGTKMGLAPLHAWKPDTYGEAPSIVGGLMAGALTSCAFLGLARFAEVALAAGLHAFVGPLLIAFGLSSLFVAAAFIIGQADIKRLLAYSSVEHMGLLALGLGLGGVGAYGSVLHLINNGLIKGMLFLVVGNLVLAAGTSVAADMRGMKQLRPASALLLLVGLFAITGSPPFGLFISEFTIITGAIRENHPWVAATIVVLLIIIFVGLARMILDIIYAEPPLGVGDTSGGERASLVVGPALLAATVLMLGLYIPAPLRATLARAAASLGGFAP
jgi:hydrogenase-4 component F